MGSSKYDNPCSSSHSHDSDAKLVNEQNSHRIKSGASSSVWKRLLGEEAVLISATRPLREMRSPMFINFKIVEELEKMHRPFDIVQFVPCEVKPGGSLIEKKNSSVKLFHPTYNYFKAPTPWQSPAR